MHFAARSQPEDADCACAGRSETPPTAAVGVPTDCFSLCTAQSMRSLHLMKVAIGVFFIDLSFAVRRQRADAVCSAQRAVRRSANSANRPKAHDSAPQAAADRVDAAARA